MAFGHATHNCIGDNQAFFFSFSLLEILLNMLRHVRIRFLFYGALFSLPPNEFNSIQTFKKAFCKCKSVIYAVTIKNFLGRNE